MRIKIKAAELRPGDLIFWKTGNSASVISVEERTDSVYVVCGGSVHIYDRELNKNKLMTVERKQIATSAPQCHPYQLFYNQALAFLKEHLPEGVTEKNLIDIFYVITPIIRISRMFSNVL